MEEKKLTKRIKIVNYVLIVFLLILIFLCFKDAKGTEDVGALAYIPIMIVLCAFESSLIFELADLEINRGFYQIKAYINSAIMIILAILMILIINTTILGMIFLGLSIYHGLLARKDLATNHPKVNKKNAILTTIGLLLTIPVLIFLILIITSIFG